MQAVFLCIILIRISNRTIRNKIFHFSLHNYIIVVLTSFLNYRRYFIDPFHKIKKSSTKLKLHTRLFYFKYFL